MTLPGLQTDIFEKKVSPGYLQQTSQSKTSIHPKPLKHFMVSVFASKDFSIIFAIIGEQ